MKDNTHKLTHKDIVNLCVEFARDWGWTPFSISEVGHHVGMGLPDLMLWKRNKKNRALEVKPSRAPRKEIRLGIGQCAYYLLHDVQPYLVIPEVYGEELLNITTIAAFDWLGVIIYNNNGKLSVIRGESFFP